MDVAWRCRCGEAKGVVRELSPEMASRCVCYCRDCRAFAHHLGREDLLDAHGGIDVVQVARARFVMETGRDRLRCLRLSSGGLYRFYVECCKTPVANTLPRVPFAGLCRVALETTEAGLPDPDHIHGGSALGGLPPGVSRGLTFRAIARPGKLFATWVARRLGHPTPLFDANNEPVSEPVVMSTSDRQKLREHPRA